MAVVADMAADTVVEAMAAVDLPGALAWATAMEVDLVTPKDRVETAFTVLT